jgi:Nitrile hydratase beta subunit
VDYDHLFSNLLQLSAFRYRSHYYYHWLAALERLVTAKGLVDSAALVARKEAWAEAYRRTPHGVTVALDRRL